jgi:hypothetical protein
MQDRDLTIVRKEQSRPENYAHFFLRTPKMQKEIRVVLYNGTAIECSRHKRALSSEPCECMCLANAAPDKDQYWKPAVETEDYSDLIDS